MILGIIQIILVIFCFMSIHESPSVFAFVIFVNGLTLGCRMTIAYVRYLINEVKK